MKDLEAVPELHDSANAHWHDAEQAQPVAETAFLRLVLRQHRTNFDLWHQEDAARDPHATDASIATVKRAIDSLNQQRNDLAEQMDEFLLELLGKQNDEASQHSETPGLIIDRLSIMSLKIFHTAEQTERRDATEEHRARNRDRLMMLRTQRSDLAACLRELLEDVHAGRRSFKVYRQFKMYNDPSLNPVLYRKP